MRSEPCIALSLALLVACSLDTGSLRGGDGGEAMDAGRDAPSVDAPVADAPTVDVPATDTPPTDAPDANLPDAPEPDAPGDAAPDSPDAACSDERCDAVDNDCDGRVDEAGADCTGGRTCVQGRCVDGGSTLWFNQVATRTSDSERDARDRILGVTSDGTSVYATGTVEGDTFSWGSVSGYDPGDEAVLLNMGLESGAPGRAVFTHSSSPAIGWDVAMVDGAVWNAGFVSGLATIAEERFEGASTAFLARFEATLTDPPSPVSRIDTTTDAEAIAPFGDGIVVAGQVDGRLTEGLPCPDVAATSGANPGMLVMTLDPAGAIGWCRPLGVPTAERPGGLFVHDVAVNRVGDIYVAATFGGEITIGVDRYDAGPRAGAVLVKLAGETGNVLWTRALVGSGRAGGQAVSATDDHGVVFGGSVVGNTMLEGGEPLAVNAFSDTAGDPYLLRFTDEGDVDWVRVERQTFDSGVFALEVDRGELFVGGWHHGVAFGCTPVDTTGGGGEDAYIVRLDVDAPDNCRWIRSLAGPFTDRVRALSVDPVHDIVVVGGEVNHAARLDGETEEVMLEGRGADGFVAAFAR